MTDRATQYLDQRLKAIPGFTGVYFGGPPAGSRNPSIVYAVTGDMRYPTLANPDRVIAVDYQITVRSNDSSEVEALGQRVWDALARGSTRISGLGGYSVDKYVADDGTEETESEYFATRAYRVRVR